MTEHPFGCGSDGISADCNLPPERRFVFAGESRCATTGPLPTCGGRGRPGGRFRVEGLDLSWVTGSA
jgi:hypothetical protein